jgi:hypothetical protein
LNNGFSITKAQMFEGLPKGITIPKIQAAFKNIKLSDFDDSDLKWYLKYEDRLEERRKDLLNYVKCRFERSLFR